MDQHDSRPASAASPEAPVGASGARGGEAELYADVAELIEARRAEDALDRFLTGIPGVLGSKLNRRDKLNALVYLSRWLQGSTSSKHGPEKLWRKHRVIERHLRPYGFEPKGAFLDLGCGHHDPIAMSALYYLNGFDRAIACDLRGPRIARYSATAMFDVIAHLTIFPDRYRLRDADPELFRARLASLDAAAFETGDFERGLAALDGKVDFHIGDILDAEVADGELGLAVSFAVLEHVAEIDAVLAWLFRATRPGGLHFHFIDLVDHRSYARDGRYDAWSFLTEEKAPPGMNRLRKSEQLAAMRRAGFDILVASPIEAEMPEATRAALLPRYKVMSEDDLRTTQLRVVLRRPETT